MLTQRVALTGVPGLAGAGSWVVIADGHLSTLGIAVVTCISVGFGMMSSLSRIKGATAARTVRTLLMNAGAVWIAAFALAQATTTDIAGAALIGLGIGLAGTRALEVVEVGAMTVMARVLGRAEGEKRQQEQNLLAAATLGARAALAEHDEKVAAEAEQEESDVH